MADTRPTTAEAIASFGVDVTVARLAPDDAPIQTQGIWMPPSVTEGDVGRDYRMAEPRRVMAIPKSAITDVPDRGASVTAPMPGGSTSTTWLTDGIEKADDEYWFLYLKRTTTP